MSNKHVCFNDEIFLKEVVILQYSRSLLELLMDVLFDWRHAFYGLVSCKKVVYIPTGIAFQKHS